MEKLTDTELHIIYQNICMATDATRIIDALESVGLNVEGEVTDKPKIGDRLYSIISRASDEINRIIDTKINDAVLLEEIHNNIDKRISNCKDYSNDNILDNIKIDINIAIKGA